MACEAFRLVSEPAESYCLLLRDLHRLAAIAPAPPMKASTMVGSSGESSHPVCACRGRAVASIRVKAKARAVLSSFMVSSNSYFGGLHMRHESIGIVALVSDDGLGLACAEQLDGWGVVADMTGSDQELRRHAQLVHQQMNLDRQSSSGTPQSLVWAPFFGPVAACWWALTSVESIIRYWFFLSRTNSWKTRSHTPE